VTGMNKRQVVRMVFEGRRPPYLPWHFTFPQETRARLVEHFGPDGFDEALDNHFLMLGTDMGFFEDIPEKIDKYPDRF